MTLKEYLYKNRISPWKFAQNMGISSSTIASYLKGNRPSFRIACKIEEFTNKQVTLEELRGPFDESFR